jgi:hypothetical protein
MTKLKKKLVNQMFHGNKTKRIFFKINYLFKYFISDVNTSTHIRLFGQFKQNGFGFNNVSSSTFGQITSLKDKSDDQNSSSTYFTNTLSKISTTSTTAFGSSSTPLAASLASLGAK